MQGANSSSSENDFMTNIQIELAIFVCVSCSSQFFEKLNFPVVDYESSHEKCVQVHDYYY